MTKPKEKPHLVPAADLAKLLHSSKPQNGSKLALAHLAPDDMVLTAAHVKKLSPTLRAAFEQETGRKAADFTVARSGRPHKDTGFLHFDEDGEAEPSPQKPISTDATRKSSS